jgi:hypothetical protein
LLIKKTKENKHSAPNCIYRRVEKREHVKIGTYHPFLPIVEDIKQKKYYIHTWDSQTLIRNLIYTNPKLLVPESLRLTKVTHDMNECSNAPFGTASASHLSRLKATLIMVLY